MTGQAFGIGHRGRLRERYRNAADEMERVAKFLRKPHPLRHAFVPAQFKACSDA
jgi:hypothetical protein